MPIVLVWVYDTTSLPDNAGEYYGLLPRNIACLSIQTLTLNWEILLQVIIPFFSFPSCMLPQDNSCKTQSKHWKMLSDHKLPLLHSFTCLMCASVCVQAQGLHGPITSSQKLAFSSHHLYVKIDADANRWVGKKLKFAICLHDLWLTIDKFFKRCNNSVFT